MNGIQIYPVRTEPDSSGSSQVGTLDHQSFHYSKYDFEATDKAVMLALKKGQVVKVLPEAEALTNSEWCYVEDRNGNKGYVPRQYLRPYRF